LATDAGAKLADLLTSLIAARALDPVLFGQYVAFAAAALLASSLWDFGLSTVLTREVAAGRLSVGKAIARVAGLRLRLLPLWVIVFAAAALILDRGRPLPPAALVGFAGTSLVFSANLALTSALRGRMRFRFTGLATAGARWLTALLSIPALLVTRGDVAIAVLGLALLVGEAVCLAACLIGLASERRPVEHHGSAGLSLKAALPFALNGILAVAYNRFDVVILTALTNIGQLSLYAPASRLQDALYLLPSSIGLVAMPFMASAKGSGGMPELRRIVNRLIVGGLCVALPTTFLVYWFAPNLIDAVLGAQYRGAVQTTRILVWFLPLAVVQAPVLAALIALGRGGTTTRIFATTFAVAIGMHLSLDWWLGANGGAIASLSRDPVAAVLCLFVARRASIIGKAPRVLIEQPDSQTNRLAASGRAH
jgi:O-antigen/teichoic acid export membrane protein